MMFTIIYLIVAMCLFAIMFVAINSKKQQVIEKSKLVYAIAGAISLFWLPCLICLSLLILCRNYIKKFFIKK